MTQNKQNLSRRDFLLTAGTIAAGTMIGGAKALAGQATEPAKAAVPVKVSTRPFGKTGVQVSCLAAGGMFDIVTNQLVLKQALNWGVTYWDTAESYTGGKSELGIGHYFEKNPEVRKQVFLVTKSPAPNPEARTKMLNGSLERMKTDSIDLYFLHGVKNPAELNDDVKAWAAQAKADKKIKFFGFSTHQNMAECLAAAAKLGWIDGIMLKYDFRLMHQDAMKAAVDACAQAGIGLTAMKTQGGGPVKVDSEAELALAGRFIQQGFTDRQARLKAVWENNLIASICSQMPNLTILGANVAAAVDRTKLSARDHELLQRYAQETCTGYCAGCTSRCEGAISHQAPIGDVMRCLMYHRDYGDRDLARAVFAALPGTTRRRMAALDYSAAERICPQGLAIGKLMREAAELFA
ncbi:MAG: aldo/keto reductase [Kiritimatiellota bacterium]|nr:aldo/keto reductase [Kiritimatiellota bacterium]